MSVAFGSSRVRLGTRAVLAVFLGLALAIAIVGNVRPARAATDPGTIPPDETVTNSDPLVVQVTETGFIYLSTDGLGSLVGGHLFVTKPSAGATVRSAYLFAASTGFSHHTLVNREVTLASQDVIWEIVIPSAIQSFNGWANVTSIVKPTLDAAAVGGIAFAVTELDTFLIDGEGLAVIWNDPDQTVVNTIVLMFGAQNPAGDDFKVLYAAPINKSDPNLLLEMSLGISHSNQTLGCPGSGQFSTIDVNGTRMSSSAGGQDDRHGSTGNNGANGALMTVGGIGDNDTLPADPLSSCDPLGARQDNELYNINRFVKTGDTSTTIHTHNPSNDDNILFAGFFLKSVSAVVGAGIVLSPTTATNVVTLGATHTVTATVQANNGNPVVGTTVTFTITAGPNVGARGVCIAGSCTTNASGKVSFTYGSNGSLGTDTIKACFTDATNTLRCATATKMWVAPPEQQISAQGVTFNATEGQVFSGTVATFTDPDRAVVADYSATISWGDGATTAGTIGGGPKNFTVSGSHTYAEEGTYTVKVTITDVDASNTATATSTANVSDAALTATAACPTTSTLVFDGTTATFTDAAFPSGTLSDFSATTTISWGDGTTTAGTVTGPVGVLGTYTVSGTHMYTSTGSHTIITTITDVGGAPSVSATCSTIVFAFASGGSFVVGDKSDTDSVLFWGAQWAKDNILSGGDAPRSFKGFEDGVATPTCPSMVNWTTDPGNSSGPPDSIPPYMAVIVSSSISKSGSTISGNTVHMVVVKTDPGYAPNPGHPGTGTVVAVIC